MTNSRRSLRLHLITGLSLVALLTLGIGGWAATQQISGALIAPGQLVVDSSSKKVQHPTGGVVGELRVKEGDHVHTGDLLVKLDETVTRANLAIVTSNLDELQARQARLEAERDEASAIAYPKALLDRSSDPAVARLMASESNLFTLRFNARAGQKLQLKERILQLQQEGEGLARQISAKQKETALITSELKGVQELYAKQLIQVQRLTALQRDAARIDGELGQLFGTSAQVKGKVTETNLQIIQIDQDMRSDVAKELGEIRGKIAELVERKIAAEDQLRRIDIRSPQDGTVHQLALHTIGGVVTAGDVLMLIVPDADSLIVEARVNPVDIDQVRTGQAAVMRLSAFSQKTTPELNGTVSRIGADVSTDQRTGQVYYTIRILLPPEEIARLGEVRLIPGMPVESFVQTGERTILSYLVKPLSDQVARAFREK